MKFIAYILVVALFLASLGTTLFYFPELESIRENMQKQLENNTNRTELVFSREAFKKINWTRKHKEFRYHGEMYDVISVKSENGKVLISCLCDKEETALRQELEDFFSPSSDRNNPVRHAVKILSLKYISGIQAFSLPYPGFLAFSFKPYHFFTLESENLPEFPPPQC